MCPYYMCVTDCDVIHIVQAIVDSLHSIISMKCQNVKTKKEATKRSKETKKKKERNQVTEIVSDFRWKNSIQIVM